MLQIVSRNQQSQPKEVWAEKIGRDIWTGVIHYIGYYHGSYCDKSRPFEVIDCLTPIYPRFSAPERKNVA
jgi:hypothetical protein